ncbi:MAG: MlaD family protein [Candidatus Omnitrophota bacterium]
MKPTVNKEIIAGTFFAISLFFIIITIFALGAKTGIGEAKFLQYVVFNDVGGLKVGAPVRISGVNVGSVAAIEFIGTELKPSRRVKVTLSVLSRYKKQLDAHSVYTIKTEGLLGDKLIDIQEDLQAKPVNLTKEGYIIGQDPLDIHNLADDFSRTTKYFNYLSNKMAQLVEDLQLFARISSRTVERLEDRLIEGNLFSLFTGPGPGASK